MNRWTPNYNPENLEQVELWAEKARRPLRRLIVACLILVSGLVMVGAFMLGPIFTWAAVGFILTGWIVTLDYFSWDRSVARVWRHTLVSYPGEIREGQPNPEEGRTRLKAGSKQDYFRRTGVSIELWRVKRGHWQRACSLGRAEWFRRPEAAEAYRRRLVNELSVDVGDIAEQKE